MFEKAALKYKTKICRELVKALDSYIGDCREQLGRYESKDSSASALHEDIEWLFNEAEADLAYYRQIKSDIAEVGIEEALRHSSRKVTPPSNDMPQDGVFRSFEVPDFVA